MASPSCRRLASLLFRHRLHRPIPQGFPVPCQSSKLIRGIQTKNEPRCTADEDAKDPENNSNHRSSLAQIPNSAAENSNANVNYSASSSLKVSARHDLAMIFTCRVCETRSVKTVCRESYDKGVVLARCGGCNNVHLIADRLGWFGQPGSVEDFLAARGEEVVKGSADTLNLTLEDLVGHNNSSP